MEYNIKPFQIELSTIDDFTSIPWGIIRPAMQSSRILVQLTLSNITYLKPSKWKVFFKMGNASSIPPFTYPKITAFQSMILLSCGAPLMPAGGSCCNLLKSLINLFLAGVDILTAYKLNKRPTQTTLFSAINCHTCAHTMNKQLLKQNWTNDRSSD